MGLNHRKWHGRTLIAACCLAAAMAILAARGCSKSSNGPVAPHPRIVSFSPALTDMLFDLGLGEHVVGVTTQCELPSGVTRTRVGDRFNVNAESIAAVEPDMVFIQQDANDFAALKKIKPAVQVEHFTIETLADIGSAVERIGKLAGREEAGKTARAKFLCELEAIKKRIAGLQRPKVLFLVLYEPDKPATGGKSSFVHEMIELAGGVDTAEKYARWSDLNAEGVLAMAPDVLVCWTDPSHENAVRDYWTGFKGLPAAQNGRVYVVTDRQWTIPSMKTAQLAGKLAEMIHPEAPAPKRQKPPRTGTVEERVIQIVSEQMGVQKTELSQRTRLKEDLKADDLDVVELTMDLEDEFGISLSDDEAASLKTVGQMIDWVAAHAAQSPASKSGGRQ